MRLPARVHRTHEVTSRLDTFERHGNAIITRLWLFISLMHSQCATVCMVNTLTISSEDHQHGMRNLIQSSLRLLMPLIQWRGYFQSFVCASRATKSRTFLGKTSNSSLLKFWTDSSDGLMGLVVLLVLKNPVLVLHNGFTPPLSSS